jgi:ribosomal protein L16/L10AE
MEGVTATEAREALTLAASKLPILTKFATRFAEEKAS